MSGEAYKLRDVRKLRGGDHFCGLFPSEEERLANLAHFVEDGLTTNCKVIVSEPELSKLKAYMSEQLSRQMEEALLTGQLVLHRAGEAYLKDGVFSAEKIIKRWVQMEAVALEQGYRLLFASGEPYWLNDLHPDVLTSFVRHLHPPFHYYLAA